VVFAGELLKGVADIAMAMNTQGRFAARVGRHELMHDIFVTMKAGGLGHTAIARLDLDGVVKILERKRQGMIKPVVGFDDPFLNGVVGEMAVIARGDAMMAGVLPGVEMILHDMAVGARLGIAAEIAGPFAVTEGESADAAQDSEHHDDSDGAGSASALADGLTRRRVIGGRDGGGRLIAA
jgi:hypothetical protein